MYWVIATCILIVLATYYIVYLLGKKSGRQEWTIEISKLKKQNDKKDRKRFDKNMGGSVDNAINELRQNTDSDI